MTDSLTLFRLRTRSFVNSSVGGPTFVPEKAVGLDSICGIDEAGRGPLAGPVMAAAVILNRHDFPEGINDSKKLS